VHLRRTTSLVDGLGQQHQPFDPLGQRRPRAVRQLIRRTLVRNTDEPGVTLAVPSDCSATVSLRSRFAARPTASGNASACAL
jgi:hypothetical protein